MEIVQFNLEIFQFKIKKNSWQLKKKLWYSQLNITAHFQAILDHVTIVIRLPKIVFCKAFVSFETSIDGSEKRGSDIKSQMLWATSFLQIHHIQRHLKSSKKLCSKDIGQILTLKFPNLFDCTSLVWFFWRWEMVAGAQIHL